VAAEINSVKFLKSRHPDQKELVWVQLAGAVGNVAVSDIFILSGIKDVGEIES